MVSAGHFSRILGALGVVREAAVAEAVTSLRPLLDMLERNQRVNAFVAVSMAAKDSGGCPACLRASA